MTGDRKNSPAELRSLALKLLARREHTRAELARKLSARTDEPHEVEHVLDECERRGWLSEQRVVEQRVHTLRGRYGARRIEHDLARKGVSGAAISAAVAGLKSGELEAARAVWRRKFGGRLPRSASERARQARFMQGRGFALEVVLKVIGGKDDD